MAKQLDNFSAAVRAILKTDPDISARDCMVRLGIPEKDFKKKTQMFYGVRHHVKKQDVPPRKKSVKAKIVDNVVVTAAGEVSTNNVTISVTDKTGTARHVVVSSKGVSFSNGSTFIPWHLVAALQAFSDTFSQ